MSLKKINPSPPPAPSISGMTWTGWLFALCTTLAFSITPSVGRAAILSGMDSTEVLIGRFGSGALLLWLTQLVRPSKGAALDLHGMGSIGLVGLLNGIGMLLLFSALTRLDASIVSMIISTLPVFVLLILAFRGEALTQRKVIRLLLAMAGLYVLIGPGGEVDMMGVTLAMISLLFFASQLVLSQALVQMYDNETVARYVTTTMLIVVCVYWWLQDGDWQWPTPEGWFYIALLGVISTYAARLLLYATIRRIGSGQMSLMLPLETLMGITWAVLFLNEHLTPIQWVGGALIVSSAVLAIERMR